MTKRVTFEVKPQPNYRSDTVQLTLLNEVYGRRTEKRTFTVTRWSLEQALKEAGLYETVERKVELGYDPNSIAQSELLQAEIAWYTAIRNSTGGTPTVASQRDALWSRITGKLGLQ